MGTRANNNGSDFDPNALTQKTDEHTAALEELQKRVGTNENFAKTFNSAAATQSLIEQAVEKTVIKLLNHNTDTQTAVETIINKVDGRQARKQWLGLGKIGLWILSLIITAVVTAWITVMVTNANTPKQPTNSSTAKP